MKFYQNALFPLVNDLFTKPFIRHRKSVLSTISGDILEIGFGSGLSIECYPDLVRKIVGLEPNLGMCERAKKLINNTEQVEVELVEGAVESMPFADKIFDAVVSFFTLCSVEDLDAAIFEIRRVLKPGGKIYLIEHTIQSKGLTRACQNLIQPVWKKMACGCNINRDTLAALKQAGFSVDEVKLIGHSGFPNLLSPIWRATAILT